MYLALDKLMIATVFFEVKCHLKSLKGYSRTLVLLANSGKQIRMFETLVTEVPSHIGKESFYKLPFVFLVNKFS